MSSNTCHQVTLAKHAIAQVQRCTHCECISVHVGPTTLRLDAHALESLWLALGEAVAALHLPKDAERRVRGVA